MGGEEVDGIDLIGHQSHYYIKAANLINMLRDCEM